jgi:metallophosphoesterase (TIGR03767 family)
MRTITVLIAAALVLAAAPAADARPQTTVTQTIVDRDQDDRLETGPGEAHLVRDDLERPQSGRDRRRLAQLFFAQMTDTHVIDEESPLRVEFLDQFGGIFTSAYRPQEGISPQVLDQMVRQLRNTVSPITQDKLDLVMTTGDNTDNTQLNETRWMIDVMDGRPKVNPDSGVAGPCGPKGYDGVRGAKRYYEPNRSDGRDGPGYSPRPSENGRPVRSRDFKGLFTRMNEPFDPYGFRDLPWYAVFGNHDGLVQGNQPRNPALEALATGCIKPTNLSDAAFEAILAGAEGDGEAAIRALRTAIIAEGEDDEDANTVIVPPDPKRKPLRKHEWIQQHFNTTGQPKGHGFENRPESQVDGQGNYDFSPRPGVRFVVLDTVAEHGLEEGNVDDDQYRWLHEVLTRAELPANQEKVFVFAHHSLATMGQPPISPFLPPGDAGGNLNPVVHFGNGPRDFPGPPLPCAKQLPSDPPDQTETIRCLLLRHPSVIAFVNGHEHKNRVDPIEGGPTQHGFWEINTASHIDWPQQSRVLDLVDNRDGTLSIFATIVDHAAPPEPGAPPSTQDGQGQAGASQMRLASISRELAFNDHQQRHSETGEGGGRGSRDDRNVELVVRNPFPPAPASAPASAPVAAPALPIGR